MRNADIQGGPYILAMIMVSQRKLYAKRYFESEDFQDVEVPSNKVNCFKKYKHFFTELLECSCHTTLQILMGYIFIYHVSANK